MDLNPPNDYPDKRLYPRISGSIIEYSYLSTPSFQLTAFLKDLSMGGACIYAHDEIPPVTNLALLIHHFSDEAPIEARGQVIWQRPSKISGCFDTGIRFIKLEPEEQAKLTAFIESFLRGHPEGISISDVEMSTPEGVYQQFYSSGEMLSEVNVVEGKMQGLQRYYYRSGTTLEELNWINGIRSGPRRCYYPNGQLYLEQEFRGGKSIYVRWYDKHGKLIKESHD
ncbi:MAG: PilZ domain-containing protein [Candidatus Omnitrophica bacterium]|nr:PilZ domain-containing protein [Candidatus Omnitrophota bacterium]